MKITLAKTAGFCFGVDRAVKMVYELLENGESLPEGVFPYVYFSGETSTDEFYTVCESDLTEEEIKSIKKY